MIYGFRARALAHALPALGLAIRAPAGGVKGLQGFLLSPAGLAVAALALMALGASVEETGTVKRIRAGLGLRLGAAALLIPAVGWSALLDAPTGSLGTMGWVVTFAGLALVSAVARRDAAVLGDLRHGQDVRLESVSSAAIRLIVRGAALSIPSGLVQGAAVGSNLEGRAALIEIRDRARITGDASRLPWIAQGPRGDTFVLTEHQAGLDAQVLVQQILEAAAAAREGGYR